MTTILTDSEKYSAVRKLQPGAQVKCTDGGSYEFIRMKQTKFIGKSLKDNRQYDIPYKMFVEIVADAPIKKLDTGYKTLKEGELFYITDQKRDDAILFIFVEMRNGRIIGKSPITNGQTRIDVNLYRGKVADIGKE